MVFEGFLGGYLTQILSRFVTVQMLLNFNIILLRRKSSLNVLNKHFELLHN